MPENKGHREATYEDVEAWLLSAELFIDWCAQRGAHIESEDRSV